MKVLIPAQPKRKLGQNFLRDQNVLHKIIEFIDPKPDDLILEIGGGTGALTSHLSGHILVVEIDESLIPFLQNIEGVTVIHDDIRNLNLAKLPLPVRGKGESRGERSLRVVGNLPYYISTPILSFLLENGKFIRDMALMFQEEVADRIVAKPSESEYSLMSVLSQYYCEIDRGFRITRNCFVPRPDVDSRILRFRFQTGWKLEYRQYHDFLAKAFSQRRKKLRNNLLRTLDITSERLDSIFAEMGLGENDRAENLTPRQYERLILETNK
jgi:16S rRNA (adenine1518-N6/adenine1519-N6)-dimethyltransferase